MPQIEPKWTTGNVATFLGIVVTFLTLLAMSYGWGQAWGELSNRVTALEGTARQSATDSRTLLELKIDVAYIKRAVQDIRGDGRTSDLGCSIRDPARVASVCLTEPFSVR